MVDENAVLDLDELERLQREIWDGPVDQKLALANYERALRVNASALIKAARDRQESYIYAKSLCESFVAEHFPHNPDWKVLPDLIGVLTQIDNATTVTREIKDERKALRSLLSQAREAIEPFSRAVEGIGPQWQDRESHWGYVSNNTPTVGDLRKARSIHTAILEYEKGVGT